MDINLDELERLAKAAQPGPWKFLDSSGNQFVTYHKPGAKRGDRHSICALPGFGAKTKEFKFIAAANPATVLWLIARVRKLEAVAKAAAKEEM